MTLLLSHMAKNNSVQALQPNYPMRGTERERETDHMQLVFKSPHFYLHRILGKRSDYSYIRRTHSIVRQHFIKIWVNSNRYPN